MNNPGTLYVLATPIGNLQDMTFRALEILNSVDLIAAEDTRETRKLLFHYQVPAKGRLVSFYRDNEARKTDGLVARLQKGENIALVSSRGTPGISDPAYLLVQTARRAGITVVPIPGASALSAALSVCGLPTDRVLFIGFLPRRASRRRALLEGLREEEATVVLYESPYRVKKTLAEIFEVLGQRETTLCRELTKKFEEIKTGPISEIMDYLAPQQQPKGEFIILLRKRKND